MRNNKTFFINRKTLIYKALFLNSYTRFIPDLIC
uniref:Uncharacterized protein n=1 Tax=Siphoviridae sp. ctOiG6 TaxID=2826313 RepID=A0A8S5N1W3_9CAUD|nr:MAG TPA: hypothetical protein [Siphoviridae sp. ctOiG6]